jgi:tetratricopeptide (TPR) repeat protein
MSDSQEIFQLRKEQRLEEALIKARTAFESTPQDIWVQRAYGWVLYDLLKREIESFQVTSNDVAHLAARLDSMIREYRQFGASIRPDLLHSQILTLILKVSREWPRFLDFARWWDPTAFRPEDRQPYQPPGGREIPSLGIRYAYAVGREALHHAANLNPDIIRWAEGQVDSALAQSANDQWLHYYKSQFLLNRNQNAEAEVHLLPVLRRQSQAAWVWSLYGHIQEQSNPGKAIICYQRAAQVARQPQEVGNTRISLARLLHEHGRDEEAAVQVREALAYRTSANYRIPEQLAKLSNSEWYRILAERSDLPAEPDVAAAAQEIVSAGSRARLVYRVGVIDNHNGEKALAHVAFALGDGSVLLYSKFNGIERREVGTLVEVGFIEGDSRAEDWRETGSTSIPGFVDRISGSVQRCDGHDYGFMSSSAGSVRVFIPPYLMAAAPPEIKEVASCVAVMSTDKKGKKGWKALRWVEV